MTVSCLILYSFKNNATMAQNKSNSKPQPKKAAPKPASKAPQTASKKK